MIGRAKQAHHGIEDIKIVDLEAESARAWQNFMDQMRGWTSRPHEPRRDGAARRRRRRAVGDADLVLRPPLRDRAAQGDGRVRPRGLHPVPPGGPRRSRRSAHSFGTIAGTGVCNALSANFPYGLVVNPMGLLIAWVTALVARARLRDVSGGPGVAALAHGGHEVVAGTDPEGVCTRLNSKSARKAKAGALPRLFRETARRKLLLGSRRRSTPREPSTSRGASSCDASSPSSWGPPSAWWSSSWWWSPEPEPRQPGR